MRRRNNLRPLLVLVLAALSIVALAERASAQAVITDPLPGVGGGSAREREPVVVEIAVQVSVPDDVHVHTARERARVRAELSSARRRHLGMLRRYANAMAFPVNTYEPGMLNVFVDDEGHICAAANLIARDGQRDLVQRTAAQDNYLRLAEVVGGPLRDWMLSSGFTQEEIARIQEPYEYIDEEQPRRDAQRALEAEKQRVRAVLLQVARELERNTDASLELATERLLAARAAAAPTPAS
ncbi:MAG: hypothetical protein J0L92_31430 [Deltaproteobacteria bacterium]|nr:hypothetical protein [Deltaproteobacteria bacterium]